MSIKSCDHDAAIVVQISDLATAYKNDRRSFFWCPDCEHFNDEEGSVLDFDPTEEPGSGGSNPLPKRTEHSATESAPENKSTEKSTEAGRVADDPGPLQLRERQQAFRDKQKKK
jgi:hypothetical protein